jgi:hypothetical protein
LQSTSGGVIAARRVSEIQHRIVSEQRPNEQPENHPSDKKQLQKLAHSTLDVLDAFMMMVMDFE